MRKKRSTWVKSRLRVRDAFGFYNTFMYELRTEDVEEYTRFLRIFLYLLDELLQLMESDIQNEATLMQDAIPPKVKTTFLPSKCK